MESLLWGILGYAIFPFWLLIGLLDFLAHQRTRIEETSGVPESVLHLVQATQVGVPVLIVLFLEINTLTLLMIAALVLAHTLTAYWDIAYTAPRRHISPFEQFVHAFMISVPLLALLLLTVLHWDEARAIANLLPGALASETTRGGWSLEWRESPWDAQVIVPVLLASALFGLMPALMELYQTWRAAVVRPRSGSRTV